MRRSRGREIWLPSNEIPHGLLSGADMFLSRSLDVLLSGYRSQNGLPLQFPNVSGPVSEVPLQVDLSQIIMHEADEPNTVVDLFSDGHANSVALAPHGQPVSAVRH